MCNYFSSDDEATIKQNIGKRELRIVVQKMDLTKFNLLRKDKSIQITAESAGHKRNNMPTANKKASLPENTSTLRTGPKRRKSVVENNVTNKQKKKSNTSVSYEFAASTPTSESDNLSVSKNLRF